MNNTQILWEKTKQTSHCNENVALVCCFGNWTSKATNSDHSHKVLDFVGQFVHFSTDEHVSRAYVQ